VKESEKKIKTKPRRGDRHRISPLTNKDFLDEKVEKVAVTD
jgi:hypothetical protein